MFLEQPNSPDTDGAGISNTAICCARNAKVDPLPVFRRAERFAYPRLSWKTAARVPMAGEDVAFEACVSAGQAVRIANRLRVEINLDPRRGTSYHRYGVACQRFSKI